MKSLFIYLALAFLCFYTFAQAPEGFNYQGIARDSKGKELLNIGISLRLSILTNSATGSVVYSESHSTTTNNYGLFRLKIGEGNVLSGIFRNINWASTKTFLKVEMDVAGGTNYSFLGCSQLISVPYALMANTAKKSLNDLDTSAVNELQILKLSNDTLYLDRGGFVFLGKYDDKTAIKNIQTKLISDSSYFIGNINNERTSRLTNDNLLSQKIVADSNYLKGLFLTNTMSIGYETNSRINADNNQKSKQIWRI